MEEAKYSSFFSWKIFSDTIAVKTVDKSVFESHGSGIPKQTRWFWGAENLGEDEKKPLQLLYDREEYTASLSTSRGRTRLFWESALSRALYWRILDNTVSPTLNRALRLHIKDFSVPFDHYLLRFEHLNKDCYKVEILPADPVQSNSDLISLETLETVFKEKQKHARKRTDEELKALAKKGAKKKPSRKKATTDAYVRDAYVAEYTKRRAQGACQLCGRPAPFSDKQDEPYLECHHIQWLSQGGADSITNTAALCPNCHRKMHVLNLKADREILEKKAQEKL